MPPGYDMAVKVVTDGEDEKVLVVNQDIVTTAPASGDLLVFENGEWTVRHLATADMPSAMATDAEVTTAVANHVAASDPHTGYQKESEKGSANGYAGLGADTKVPAAQIASIANGFFGDGSDGALNFDGAATVTGAGGLSLAPAANVYTLTRDLLATTVTVANGATVLTRGYRIFATGTITNNGTISSNGGNASGATGGTGAGASPITLAGTNGGTGLATNATGAVGTAQNAASIGQLSGPGGGGGGSGTGSPGAGATTNSDGWAAKTAPAGGTAGTAGSAGGAGAATIAGGRSATTILLRSLPGCVQPSFSLALSQIVVSGGSGGGAGAGDGTNAGGGGGGGAATLQLIAPTITNGGTMSANGGNGGNAAGGDAGGGGGGGGGPVLIVCRTFSGTTPVSVGGTHGNKGTNGANGGDGGTGTVLVLQFS